LTGDKPIASSHALRQDSEGEAVIFKLQVVAIAEDGHQETCEITSVERRDLKPETLGLTLAEGKAILKGIQQIVIQRQADTCWAPYRQRERLSQTRSSFPHTFGFLRSEYRSEPSPLPSREYSCDTVE
jgi:hypothetical protein